jgi:hypothetical protein
MERSKEVIKEPRNTDGRELLRHISSTEDPSDRVHEDTEEEETEKEDEEEE